MSDNNLLYFVYLHELHTVLEFNQNKGITHDEY